MEWTYDKEKIAESYLIIGEACQYGDEADPFMAFVYYKKAADLGNVRAAVILSEYYREKRNYPEELKWLKKVNENKDKMPPHIAYRLGCFYQYGWEGEKTDWTKAHELFQQAAEGGSKSAKSTLRLWSFHKMSCILRAAFE